MPAQSPTLSPTLSAMVAGLRGSSSGIPASTLPTRSAPTSAPLVKMPPPRRSEEHTSELQSRPHLVCRLLLEKKNNDIINNQYHATGDNENLHPRTSQDV